MNNYCDEVWFGRKDVFNVQNGQTREPIREKINFPEGKTWQDYVDSPRLEIACGEGPYLVSRYDVATSNLIRHTINRIGILDRKLRIVNENTTSKEDWIEWAIRAVQASYGYEYQGDSLLIARINVLLTFVDYYEKGGMRMWIRKSLKNYPISFLGIYGRWMGLLILCPLGHQLVSLVR